MGFEHIKDYLDRATASTKKMGVNASFRLRWTAGTNKLWFGRFAVCHKACFMGHLYTANSIAAVEKTIFH